MWYKLHLIFAVGWWLVLKQFLTFLSVMSRIFKFCIRSISVMLKKHFNFLGNSCYLFSTIKGRKRLRMVRFSFTRHAWERQGKGKKKKQQQQQKCPGETPIWRAPASQILVLCTGRNNVKRRCLTFLKVVSFVKSQIKPRSDLCLLGVLFQFSDEQPRPFHVGFPPDRNWKRERAQQRQNTSGAGWEIKTSE